MIDCDFIVFKNCNHCVYQYIALSYIWVCTLITIHKLNTKLSVISIDKNNRIEFFRLVQIIWWRDDTKSFMNGNISILEGIANIKNPGSDMMNSQYSNIDMK